MLENSTIKSVFEAGSKPEGVFASDTVAAATRTARDWDNIFAKRAEKKRVSEWLRELKKTEKKNGRKKKVVCTKNWPAG